MRPVGSYEKRALAREFRKRQTPAETASWAELRTNKIGFHFRRQCPIAGFIVDFCCLTTKLVVEVDGPVHDGQVEADNERSEIITGVGFEVMRLTNEEALHHPADCAARIRSKCLNRVADLNPSPAAGKGGS